MNKVDSFIDAIHAYHLENAQSYFVRNLLREGISQENWSQFTNFISEYFLFNSLYAVDWERTEEKREVCHHSKDCRERERRGLFFEVLRREGPEIGRPAIEKTFVPLCAYRKVIQRERQNDADAVSEISSVSVAARCRFFRDLDQFVQEIEAGNLIDFEHAMRTIEEGASFISGVRNNIFHGTKTPMALSDPQHRERLEIYDLFIRCVNSLFFVIRGKDKFGSERAQLPILSELFRTDRVDSGKVLELISRKRLKREDSHLLWKLRKLEQQSNSNREPLGALFYPSAGGGGPTIPVDFLLPILVAHPYCSSFHFFDREMLLQDRAIEHFFRDHSQILPTEIREEPEVRVIHCRFPRGEKQIWLHRKDNLRMDEIPEPITFFFSRGDSVEGASRLDWSRDELWRVLKKADKKIGLHFLSDCLKNDPSESVNSLGSWLELPVFRRKYFYAYLRDDGIDAALQESQSSVSPDYTDFHRGNLPFDHD